MTQRMPRLLLSDSQRLSLLSMFATVWALAELQIGNQLHWAHVPFAGLVLTACGLVVLTIVRAFVPRSGSVVMVGTVVAIVKGTLGGPAGHWASVGILVESLAVEAIFCTGSITPWRAALAGSAAMAWSFLHPFVVQGLIAGQGVLRIYALVLQETTRLFGFQPEQAWLPLVLLLNVHLALGAGVGLLGWRLSNRLLRLIITSIPSVRALREG